ncbi:hypothetical protein [Parasitella parasitica]|uniref:Major facilitator superfamily (MFS) profile domain-containing protein n=1 Tax=Parasitella parasitica TaxID=35722 RepID=A0A0B7NMR8_9FUNG|nr:hypothetical protein [Parasitella parasitica]
MDPQDTLSKSYTDSISSYLYEAEDDIPAHNTHLNQHGHRNNNPSINSNLSNFNSTGHTTPIIVIPKIMDGRRGSHHTNASSPRYPEAEDRLFSDDHSSDHSSTYDGDDEQITPLPKIKDFHLSDDEKEIGSYAGWITSVFFVAQFCTAIMWGRVSDRYGRRPVLLTGLVGNSISSCLFGLSKNLWWAIASRALCGIMNGNSGVARSMVSEITDNTNKAKAFSIFGFCWGSGMIGKCGLWTNGEASNSLRYCAAGPVLGGYLAKPAEQFPSIFGDSAFFIKYPYLLPCFVSACGSMIGFVIGYFYLKESNPNVLASRKWEAENEPNERTALLTGNNSAVDEAATKRMLPKSGSMRLITRTSIAVIIAYSVFGFHAMVFEEVLPLYFTAPVNAGGLGITRTDFAKTLSFFGVIQLIFQFGVYPRLTRHYSILDLCRFAFLIFLPVYFLFPELSVLREWVAANHPGSDPSSDWTFRAGYLLLMLIRYGGVCSAYTGLGIMVRILCVPLFGYHDHHLNYSFLLEQVSMSAAPEILGTVNGSKLWRLSLVKINQGWQPVSIRQTFNLLYYWIPFYRDTSSVRFTSPGTTGSPSKKYTTPKSPIPLNNGSGGGGNSNNGNNSSNSTNTAPRPINLPSLKREHAAGSDVPASSSPATSHGWGSAVSSPSMIQQQVAQTTDTEPSVQPSEKKRDVEAIDKTKKSPDTAVAAAASTTSTSPVLTTASNTKAWAVPTITHTQAPYSTDFPTAAEAASGSKKYLLYASSDPNHTSWDEMVSEDLDEFSVDVLEFEDGTKFRVGPDASSTGSGPSTATPAAAVDMGPVSPSERFTDDYDRSYPPKLHQHQQQYHYSRHDSSSDHQQQHYSPHNPHYKSYRRSEDHGYGSRYNGASYSNRRSSAEGAHERRSSGTSNSSDRWNVGKTSRRDSLEQSHYGKRRSSYDRKLDSGPYHHSNLPPRARRLSEQSFRSDHSRGEINGDITTTISTASTTNPLQIISEPSTATDSKEKITAVQKSLMLTAAERAKKRLEEREAEFKAATERAKLKADALAAKLDSESKAKTILKKPATTGATGTDNTLIAKTNKRNASPTTTTTKSPKVSLPPPQPSPSPPTVAPLSTDTSKPWNLVAANKHLPTSTTGTAVVAAVAVVVDSEPTPEPLPVPTRILKKETKPVTIMKKEKKQIEKEKEEEKEEENEEDKPKKPNTTDEEQWEEYVSAIRSDPSAATVKKQNHTASDWSSFAARLQETTAEKNAIDALNREKWIKKVEEEIEQERERQHTSEPSEPQQETPVQVLDYENEEWGSVPEALMAARSRNRGGWIRDENVYNQKRSRQSSRNSSASRSGGRVTANSNSNSSTTESGRHHKQDQEKPIVVEILKKQQEPAKQAVLSRKTRLTNLLKESSSPIFPDFIDKLAGRKPANMSFMVDTQESDEEITTPGQTKATAAAVEVEEEATSIATTATTVTSNSNSIASTPPKSHPNTQQRKMHVNRHFPVLVYQYPNQPLSSDKANLIKDAESEGHLSHQQQHRPLGVYLMPQQTYLSSNQYIVPYPQAGTGNVQPIYYPRLSWQHRRPLNNDQLSSSTTIAATANGNPPHSRYPNICQTNSRRGNSYRKRGGGGGGGGALGAAQLFNAPNAGFSKKSTGRGTAGGGRGNYQQQHHYNAGYSNSETVPAAAAAAISPPSSSPVVPLTTHN